MSKRNNLVFIKHILDAINDIQFSIKNLSKKQFIESKDVKDATIRRIEIIGESVKNMSEDVKDKYPEIEWKKIVGTRDRLIHAYFSVDLDITWDIVKINLPDSNNKILEIKENMEI